MKTLAIALALAALLPSSIALGQGRDERQEVTTYDEHAFEGDVVRGDILRPDADLTRAGGRRHHVSLLRIRNNFVPELLKSVERQ
jgi:hypothetical protein